jgi:predicted nucleotidyltransferase
MRKESSSSVRIFYPRFSREDLIQKLRKGISHLTFELPLSLAVLFGSYAEGNYTVASDVDFLVVYKGKEKKDAYKTVKKSMDIALLEPHVYSEDEYKRLKKVIDRMIARGVVLFSQT